MYICGDQARLFTVSGQKEVLLKHDSDHLKWIPKICQRHSCFSICLVKEA